MLRPIAMPLVMGGFERRCRDVARPTASRASGFMPVAAAGAGGMRRPARSRAHAAAAARAIAVGVGLVAGDLELGATGTVTARGRRSRLRVRPSVLQPRADQFPMTQAYVHVVLPSLMSSIKLASFGAVVGTLQQDRATAIAGTLGAGPSMIPMTLALEFGSRRRARVQLQRRPDQLFTPLLTYSSVVNVLTSYEREFGHRELRRQGHGALVEQHGDVAFEDLFTGDSPSIGAAGYVAGPMTFLLTNDYEPVEIDELDSDDRVRRITAHGDARARLDRRRRSEARPHGP